MKLLALLAPLPAIGVGVGIARTQGVPAITYVPNVVAVALGLLVVLAMRHLQRERLLRFLPFVAAVLIGATLFGSDLDGVHRWVSLGPLRLHLSSLLVPWVLLGLASPDDRDRRPALVAALVAQVIHLAQPDAGQATALALAMVPAAVTRSRSGALSFPGVPWLVVSLALAAATWLRHDPLLPVGHVERVLFLAAAAGPGPLLATAVSFVVLLLPLALTVDVRRPDATSTFPIYVLGTFAVTFAGAFPVPVFGAGAGPVLGYYGLLAAADADRRRRLPGT